MNQYVFIFGLAFIFLGMFLVTMYSLSSGKADVKAAGGIFLGPIPVVGWYSDKKTFYALLVLSALFFIYWLIRSRF